MIVYLQKVNFLLLGVDSRREYIGLESSLVDSLMHRNFGRRKAWV